MSAPEPFQVLRHAARPIDVGAHVFTLDGHRLGRVAEVHPEFIRLDVSLKPDYWLNRNAVWSSDLSGVHVSFRKADLDQFRVDALPQAGRQDVPRRLAGG